MPVRPSSRLAGLLLLCAGLALRADTPALLIRHATVVDVAAGRLRPEQAVLVQGDAIVAVGDDATVASSAPTARVIDARRRFVVPGLWDMHVHALWDPVAIDTALPLLLAHGITGIRDMGGSLAVLQDVRERAARGDLLAPRLFAAGVILDGARPVDPSISFAIASADEGRAAVRRLAAAHVDFLKVYTLLPAAAFAAVVDEAAHVGLRVSGHVPGDVTAREAARAGMHSIEHMQAELGTFCPTTASAAECDSLIDEFRRRGTWQTPTLAVRRARAFSNEETYVDDPRLATVPRMLREQWLSTRRDRVARLGAAGYARMRTEYAHEEALARRLHDGGVLMLAGSDAGADFSYWGSGLHDELAALVAAGLTPLQALRLATTAPAAFLGRTSRVGRVGAGAPADLVVLDGNPLEDVRALSRVHAVLASGHWLDRPRLDAMIEGARLAAR
ncbi:amidohydrolase [Luteitalea sp. TBR-22]|uniref:amidohydrolase family protein n=1 Tax=Luteitalea sp. TBR-22 TaxID=2802971 RepID=UPI001AFC6454|nr:amidohydrolase family protein [Luteitalea sp. TBR-22]BCS35371.1 amidohydrolase [Luteitalea sp. TBR-22]